MDDLPNFSRDENYEFKDGDKIYIIDDNKYDIWEAEIESVTDDGYKIHYPDYPDDDDIINDTSKFLLRDENNTNIYKNQEKIRQKKEESLKKAESDESESDDNYQQSKKKTQKKKKKEKPKKDKKPKKEKPPKEPKPKKEPKQKKAKEGRFKKISNEKEYRKILHEAIKTAFQKGINDVDVFIHFFDNTYRPIYGDKQMNKISTEAVQRYQRELARNQNNDQDGDELLGGIDSTTDDGEVSDQSEEEDITFEPEEVVLPTLKRKMHSGYEISVANTALSFNKNDSFPIIFDDDRCNAFIFKTPATQYLILNGMKFELEQIEEDESTPKFYFYDESKLAPHENQQSLSYFYPKVKKLGIMRVKESPECIKYMDELNKKKSKVSQLTWLPDIDDDNDSSHNSVKRKNKKSEPDNSRVLYRPDQIEDDDSE